MAGENEKNKVMTPKFMLFLDGMGFESTITGFETFIEVLEWGQDTYCHSSPHASASFSQQEPPTTTPFYVRIVLGLHLPKLLQAMLKKNSIKKGRFVALVSINNTNAITLEINLESITVEEILLGNNIRGQNNKNFRSVNNNEENSFEMLLRCGKIEWIYHAYKQEGAKEGQDGTSLDLLKGEVK